MLSRSVRFQTRLFSTTRRSLAAGLSPRAQPIAQALAANWKGTTTDGGDTKNFIHGEFSCELSSELDDQYHSIATHSKQDLEMD